MRFVVLAFCVACAGNSNRNDAGRFGDASLDADEDAAVADVGMDALVGTCADAPEGTPCDADGDGCTMDLCRRGRCVLGGVSACDDGLSCTTDQCVSTGAMTFTCESAIDRGCAIGGTCVADGTANPDNGCQVCDDGTPTDWSTNTGTCDDGDVCTDGDTCASGTCMGTARLDSFEANDSEAAAHDLGDASDGDAFPKGEEDATLYPDGDVDWFRYNDSDDLGSSIFPRVQVQNIPPGSNYDLCVTLDCEGNGFDSLDCTSGTKIGTDTCCSRSAGNADEDVRFDHSCDTFTDDSTNVFIEVVRVSGPATCDTPYLLRWGDD